MGADAPANFPFCKAGLRSRDDFAQQDSYSDDYG